MYTYIPINCVYFMYIDMKNIEILVKQNACINPRSRTSSTLFKGVYTGRLGGVRIVYKSGGVSCCTHSGCGQTKFGCGPHGIGLSLFKVINTGTKSGTLLYPKTGRNGWFWKLDGYDVNSKEITMIDGIYNVNENDYFMLQYYETYFGHTLSDNSGSACYDVYLIYTDAPPSLVNIYLCYMHA